MKQLELDYSLNNNNILEQASAKDTALSNFKFVDLFAGKEWNGTYQAKGTIVVKETGNQVAFHIIDIESLKSYLFNNIRLDTPSTTRHRYGKLILENDKKLYFKLNLQLRF